MSITLQIRSKGVITLPMELRRRYRLREGDVLTLVDLSDGSFVVTPRVLQINRLGDQFGQALTDAEVSVEDVFQTLDDERERYYRENYAQG